MHLKPLLCPHALRRHHPAPEKEMCLRWHPASSCTTCQGKMLSKELYSCPCINSSAVSREGQRHTLAKCSEWQGSTFVTGTTTLTTTPCLRCSGIAQEVSVEGLAKHHTSSGRDVTRSQQCHKFVLSI